MPGIIVGPKTGTCTRDDAGRREYDIVYRVVTSSSLEGPATVLNTPGLPRFGDLWIVDSDVDLWAWCRWNATVKQVVESEPNYQWDVTFKFSTKPLDLKFCRDTQFEDPLLEPQKISGSFAKYTREATADRFNKPIKNSAHELIRGPQVEFDANGPTVIVEQNVPILDLTLWNPMVDCVNEDSLWGMDSRQIKLCNASWERKFYGTCNLYFTRRFEFEVRKEGFDRKVLDEGTKALHGYWDPVTGNWTLLNIDGAAPDPDNPAHFDRMKDRAGENMRVMLNGHGVPINASDVNFEFEENTPGWIKVEKYQEADFLLLGIPADLDFST